MNKKNFNITSLITIVILITFITVVYSNKSHNTSSPNPTSTPDELFRNTSTADWASNAKTVDELMLESNLIVRARVIEEPVTHVVEIEVPTMDENGNPTHSIVIKGLVSYTIFEVLEIYMGKSSSIINISQTGGFDPTVSKGIEEISDDPLYMIGEEYILFLVDVSDNSVDKSVNELYRIVNPFGRYTIEDNNVHSYGEIFRQETSSMALNLNELELQIAEAIKLLPPEEAKISTETITDTPSEDIIPTP